MTRTSISLGEDGDAVHDDELDNMPVVDGVWSDGEVSPSSVPFTRLVCRCGSPVFNVYSTGSYETSARCIVCRTWYVVHSG